MTGAAIHAFRRHWPDYLKEAAGLLIFMLGAGAFTTLFEFPGSAVRMAIPSDLWRRILLGVVMGLVTAGIIYSPWGQRSGAHINPAVTWTFWRLGKIDWWDAVFYTGFQFLGALIAPVLLFWIFGEVFANEKVRFATTQPGPTGAAIAFVAEFAISFVLMLALLLTINSARLEKCAGAFAASLVAIYIALESPLSGMSLNPARSFGSALTAGQWNGIWLYFVAPIAAMLLAGEVHLLARRTGLIDGPASRSSWARRMLGDYKEGPRYPVEEEPPR